MIKHLPQTSKNIIFCNSAESATAGFDFVDFVWFDHYDLVWFEWPDLQEHVQLVEVVAQGRRHLLPLHPPQSGLKHGPQLYVALGFHSFGHFPALFPQHAVSHMIFTAISAANDCFLF